MLVTCKYYAILYIRDLRIHKFGNCRVGRGPGTNHLEDTKDDYQTGHQTKLKDGIPR